MGKYSVNQYSIETILSWVNSGEIAIPTIQRPFVWDASKVRDLMDSLYQGYPIGYVIAWRNPNVKLKDGSISEGKKIIIDGQQRISALISAILGQDVIDKTYKKIKIKILFNPLKEKFEVQNPAILKDKTWLHDISESINSNLFAIKDNYIKSNPDINKEKIENALLKLNNISKNPIGYIELSTDLDIETVTEIFIRINSKGVVLSQADFAMSKISSNTEYGGNELRKLIDYFCHLIISSEHHKHIEDNDKEFAKTEFYQKIKWLKDNEEKLYTPDYNDLIRVAFISQFNRGKLSDLVSLLSGRNFETRNFEAEIAEQSFEKLRTGVINFTNETNFKRFLMIIKSAGFVDSKLIRSQNTINFAYILYLKLKEIGTNDVNIEKFIKRWFVYSILTGRYSSSPESTFDYDIKQINNKPINEYLQEKEEAELSDAFWNASLPGNLDTSIANSPYFHVYLAAQVKANDKGFLSKDISVSDLISLKGNIHHLFPKDYLKKKGYEKNKYNQIANYVYMQQEINIKIGNKAPSDYFALVIQSFNNNNTKFSGLESYEQLSCNLKMHCIPEMILSNNASDYEDFLNERRKLMALKIKEYYFSL